MNLGALRSRDYRRYLLGNIFALHGIWLSRLAIAWLGWEMTGQASFVGLVAFLVFAPTLVSGPFFGVLADRVPLKRAAMLAQACLGAVALALLICVLMGILTPAILVVVALAIGLVSSAHHPVRLALTPSLVPRTRIGSAVALGSLNFNLARLTGPALGGILIAEAGMGWALALTVACFLPQIALLPGLRPRPTTPAPRDLGVLSALGDGVRYALRTPLIRRAMLVIGLFSVVARGLLEILPVLADGVFARGPTGLGTLTAASGAGALVAASFVALGPGQRRGGLPLSSRLAAPAGLALVAALAWSPSWPLTVGLVAALGLCGTLTGVGLQSSIQLALADGYRARVMSLWTMLAVGGAAVGALLLGGLVDLVGHRAAFAATGSLALLLMLPIVLPPLAAVPSADTSQKTPCRGAAPP